METTARTITKAATWQLLGIATGTAIGFLFTGSVAASGGIALTGALTGVVFYVAHEKLWARVPWGLRAAGRALSGPREAGRAGT